MVPSNNLALCFNHMYKKWSRNGAKKVTKKSKNRNVTKKCIVTYNFVRLSSNYNLEPTRPVFGSVVEVMIVLWSSFFLGLFRNKLGGFSKLPNSNLSVFHAPECCYNVKCVILYCIYSTFSTNVTVKKICWSGQNF